MLSTADKREFLRISQAVGMGFLIMGVIGYVVKLSTSNRPRTHAVLSMPLARFRSLTNPLTVHIPVNNILVGGA